jgi:hypothetical protein
MDFGIRFVFKEKSPGKWYLDRLHQATYRPYPVGYLAVVSSHAFIKFSLSNLWEDTLHSYCAILYPPAQHSQDSFVFSFVLASPGRTLKVTVVRATITTLAGVSSVGLAPRILERLYNVDRTIS